MGDFEKLSRELVDKGFLIEAGWVGLRAMAMYFTLRKMDGI